MRAGACLIALLLATAASSTAQFAFRGAASQSTNIFEVQEGPYRVVEHYTACTDSWLCLYNDTDNWSYDLYVPPGSVVIDFNLDAK